MPVPSEAKGTVVHGRYASLDEDKLRGGYYTAERVAAWLCDWAIRQTNDQVLEPSCGDGAFLKAAAERLIALGLPAARVAAQLQGVEIIPTEAARAQSRVQDVTGSDATSVVENGDFFEWWQNSKQPAFDVVVGNPPFIRYQSFPEPHRTRAMEIMGEKGLKPNRLTNIWVPFVVAAVASLKKGGRLALVLPAEILQVTYASQLRSFLTDHFARIDVVACNELFFEKAEQEVVLLLADGALERPSTDNTCRVAMTEAQTVAGIMSAPPSILLSKAQPKAIRHDSEKWLKYFLDEKQIALMRTLRQSDITVPMSNHASINVGVVTGKNQFFVLSKDQIDDLGLEGYTTPLVSRSAHLRGSHISKTEWKSLAAAGDRVHLLNITHDQLDRINPEMLRYIEDGERQNVHLGYKCSIRKPWYTVPSVWIPDGFAFRQIYDFPRMVLNGSEATSTDTIHRLTSKGEEPERIISNTYSWLTAASAEIEGRSYGGGVLELEPTEAERLLMPAKLNGAMPLSEADKLIRAGKLDAVLEENARIVLMQHMGLTAAECAALKNVWIKMRDRRMSRRRGMPKPGTMYV